ncbi:phasin family protein [Alicyclobacillus fodiniaquatilis]|jgi:polyhydroxyalkanoate synthesis regulator phasin|uniref:Phasin family protein n=1 Tax=Alicyclobacillus fodiniaquatilis TaxID=1661150 RepID=A0ABW4JAY5_9BACL
MEDTLRKMVDLGVGLMSFSRDKITETAKQWAEERKLTPVQTRQLIQALLERGEQSRTDLQQMVQEQVKKSMERIGIRENHDALQAELVSIRELMIQLNARVEALEARLTETQEEGPTH